MSYERMCDSFWNVLKKVWMELFYRLDVATTKWLEIGWGEAPTKTKNTQKSKEGGNFELKVMLCFIFNCFGHSMDGWVVVVYYYTICLINCSIWFNFYCFLKTEIINHFEQCVTWTFFLINQFLNYHHHDDYNNIYLVSATTIPLYINFL